MESAGILVKSCVGASIGYRYGYGRGSSDPIVTGLNHGIQEAWRWTHNGGEIIDSEQAIFAESEGELLAELIRRNPVPDPSFKRVLSPYRDPNCGIYLVLKDPLVTFKDCEEIEGEADEDPGPPSFRQEMLRIRKNRQNSRRLTGQEQNIRNMEALAAARVHGCVCVDDSFGYGGKYTVISSRDAKDPWENTEFSQNLLLDEGFVLEANNEDLTRTRRLWCDSSKYNRILTARRTALKKRIAKEKRKLKGKEPVKNVEFSLSKDRVCGFKDRLRILWTKKIGLEDVERWPNLWRWSGLCYSKGTKHSHVQEVGAILVRIRKFATLKEIRRIKGFRDYILNFHRGLHQIEGYIDGCKYTKAFYDYVETEYRRIPQKYKPSPAKKKRNVKKKSA